MKIAEYKQMMAYLTRPGFSGGGNVLPKKKPKEEAEKVNKARKEKNFEKVKGALENPKEVKKMIDKPKRGLVDEPGSYAGEGITVTEVNKYRKEGLTAKQIIKKLSESLDRNVNLTEYEKFLTANKSKLVKVNYGQKLTKEKIKAYDKATEKITKGKYKKYSDLPFIKGIEKLKDKIASEGRRRLKGVPEGQGGPGEIRAIVKGKETLSKSIMDILNASDERFNIGDMRKALESKNIPFTESNLADTLQRLKKIESYKNKIIKTPEADIIKKFRETFFEKRKPFIQAIADAFIADPDATPEEIAEAIYGTKNFRNASSAQKLDYLKEMSRNVEQFVEVYGNPKTFKPITKDLKAIPVNKLGNILDNIARNASAFGYGQTAVTNLQFQIADASRNFPPRTSQRLRESLQQKNFEVDEVVGRAATYQRAPGYIEATQVIPKKINQLKGKKLDWRFSKVFEEALEGNFKNVDEYNTFAKKFGKQNKIDVPIIRTGSGLNPKDFINNFDQFSPAAQKNITEIAKNKNLVVETRSKPLLALAEEAKGKIKGGGKYGKFIDFAGKVIGATAGGTGTALAADGTEATSVLPTAVGAGTGAAAVGTKTGRNILGKVFRTLGTPLAGAGFAATNVASKMGEGQSLADAVVDPITGLELSFPGLFKENLKKIIPERFQGRAARFGRGLLGLRGIPVGPIGLTLAGLGQAQEFYNQYQDLQRMKEQNPRAYSEFMESRQTPALSAAEQTAIEDMGRSGAAGGGLLKQAGDRSGKPPEAGPTPQGLASIIKRGRKY